jgi:hypothetical protein
VCELVIDSIAGRPKPIALAFWAMEWTTGHQAPELRRLGELAGRGKCIVIVAGTMETSWRTIAGAKVVRLQDFTRTDVESCLRRSAPSAGQAVEVDAILDRLFVRSGDSVAPTIVFNELRSQGWI